MEVSYPRTNFFELQKSEKVVRIGFPSVEVERLLSAPPASVRAAPVRPSAQDDGAVSSSPSDVLLQHLLDTLDHALILLDGVDRPIRLNRMAIELIDAGRAPVLIGPIVEPYRATDRARWAEALNTARQGAGGLLVMSAPASDVMVAFTPLGASGAVMVSFERLPLCEAVAGHAYRRAIGLTDAESRVLDGLLRSLSPKRIAQRHGVAESTVRTQIRSVLAKAGCRGVRELVLQVSQLPPVSDRR